MNEMMIQQPVKKTTEVLILLLHPLTISVLRIMIAHMFPTTPVILQVVRKAVVIILAQTDANFRGAMRHDARRSGRLSKCSISMPEMRFRNKNTHDILMT